MSIISPNMGLTEWDGISDTFSYSQIKTNWDKVDSHDHTSGKGVQIPTAGIANSAVTSAKIASNAVTSTQIAANAVGTTQVANNAITSAKIASGAVGASQIASQSVTVSAVSSEVGRILGDSYIREGFIDSTWGSTAPALMNRASSSSISFIRTPKIVIESDGVVSGSSASDKIVVSMIGANITGIAPTTAGNHRIDAVVVQLTSSSKWGDQIQPSIITGTAVSTSTNLTRPATPAGAILIGYVYVDSTGIPSTSPATNFSARAGSAQLTAALPTQVCAGNCVTKVRSATNLDRAYVESSSFTLPGFSAVHNCDSTSAARQPGTTVYTRASGLATQFSDTAGMYIVNHFTSNALYLWASIELGGLPNGTSAYAEINITHSNNDTGVGQGANIMGTTTGVLPRIVASGVFYPGSSSAGGIFTVDFKQSHNAAINARVRIGVSEIAF